jgi:hypothetical protein
LQQRVEAVVDLGLAGGADLVVLRSTSRPTLSSSRLISVAQVGVVVDRRDREVAALVAGLVAAVAALLDAPVFQAPSIGVDVVVAGVLLRLEAHVVEDVELGLGPKYAVSAMPVDFRYASALARPCAGRGCRARR